MMVHVPKTVPPGPLPVVIVLHGVLDSPLTIESETGFSTLADTEGFVAVYPSGVSASWNGGLCCDPAKTLQIDDVGFIDQVLDWTLAHACADKKRLFVTGFSNGGFLAQRLGCERAARFAAIAPVSATQGTLSCQPSEAVSVVEFHGTDDAVVPYAGGGLTAGLSVQATFANWQIRNQCKGSVDTVFQKGDALCQHNADCASGSAVELCVISGGGHQWPGSPQGPLPALGKMSTDINATAHIWSFFQAHAKP